MLFCPLQIRLIDVLLQNLCFFFSVLLLACCSIPSKENVLERFCFEAQAKKYWLLLPKGPQGGAGLVCPSPAPPQQVSAMPSGTELKPYVGSRIKCRSYP